MSKICVIEALDYGMLNVEWARKLRLKNPAHIKALDDAMLNAERAKIVQLGQLGRFSVGGVRDKEGVRAGCLVM